MKKLFPILLLLFLLLAACTTPAPSPTLDAGEGPRVTASPPARASVTPKPTATQPATATSSATVTSTPGVTGTPTQPGGSLPPCEEHNPDAWHALISADGSCHYDHEHKHNPMELCGSMFGEPGAWFGQPGQSISHPGETPQENMHKHEGYGWLVRCNVAADSNPDDPNPNFSRNFRVQGHIDPMPFLMPDGQWQGGYLGRQHSVSVESEVCTKDTLECGVIRFISWLNFGDLEIRQGTEVITQCAPLIFVHPKCPNGSGGNKIHFDFGGFPGELPRAASLFWYGEMATAEGSLEVLNPTVIAFAMSDSMVDVQLETLFTPDVAMYCPLMDCSLNGSTLSMHELTFNVRGTLDLDGDGFVSGFWLIDQYGRINPECEAIGQVIPGDDLCLPLIMDHVPVGPVEYGDPENSDIGPDGTQDFDVSPAGEYWITWPLKMLP